MGRFTRYITALLTIPVLARATGIPSPHAREPVGGGDAPTILTTQTITRTFSQDTTLSEPFGWSPLTWTLFRTTGVVTRYEPVPSAYPAKITVEETTVVTVFTTATWSTRSTSTASAETIWIDTQTWALSRPRATDAAALLPADADLGAACSACPGAAAVPDPVCETLGLRTGCDAAQCPRDAEGTYWCREMFPGMYSASGYRNGRACWGNGTEYKQLLAPCRAGDGVVGCTACKGDLRDFYPRNWH